MKQSSEKTAMKVGDVNLNILITVLLLAFVAVFDLLPVVKLARALFPEPFKNTCNCLCVLENRPWYGRINPWFWFWIVSTPAIVFSVRPGASAWRRAGRHVLIIALSYAVINVATVKHFDIINAPFDHPDITPYSSETDEFKYRCFNTGDGGMLLSALFLGWVYAAVYAGWWEIIWHQYHKRKTRLIDERFKGDWISKIIVFISVAIPLFVSMAVLVHFIK